MGSTLEAAIEIRPFHVEIPEDDVADLRLRAAIRSLRESTVPTRRTSS